MNASWITVISAIPTRPLFPMTPTKSRNDTPSCVANKHDIRTSKISGEWRMNVFSKLFAMAKTSAQQSMFVRHKWNFNIEIGDSAREEWNIAQNRMTRENRCLHNSLKCVISCALGSIYWQSHIRISMYIRHATCDMLFLASNWWRLPTAVNYVGALSERWFSKHAWVISSGELSPGH